MASIKIGLVGLGMMGQAIAYRLAKNSYEVIGFDPNVDPKKVKKITFTKNLAELAKKTKIIWIMVPATAVDDVIKELLPSLEKNSILIDGGNSNFKDSISRYKKLKTQKIHFLDCGTSGGLHGKELGFSLMIGGDTEIFKKIELIFKAIAAPQGYSLLGPSGCGHFIKMVHNGIEYSLLQAYSEGFDLLKNNKQYKKLDLEKISKVWLNGSIVRSWILELAHTIFVKDQEFKNISGEIGENLTGRWAFEQAQKDKIEMPLLQKSLEIRKWSRKEGGNYATKIIAMLRHEFGGHEVKKVAHEDN